MAFNPESATFGEIVKYAIIRGRRRKRIKFFPKAMHYKANLSDLMPLLAESAEPDDKHRDWLSACESVREILGDYDTDHPVRALSAIIQNATTGTVFTSDVGNNEFWLSRAYTFTNASKPYTLLKVFRFARLLSAESNWCADRIRFKGHLFYRRSGVSDEYSGVTVYCSKKPAYSHCCCKQ